MKISLSLSKYNDLICLLNLDGSTIDSLYVGKMKDYISYVEKALSWKDKEITKDLIDRIVNKGEKFNISKIRKTYNISFTEAGEIYTYLEQEKIIKTPFSERKPFKAQLNDEIIEVEINAPTDIEKDFLKCLKAYDDDLDDFVYRTAKDYILANKDLFTFDDDGTGKQYVVFADPNDEEGEVFASCYDDEGNLLPIETEEEWAMVEEVLGAFGEEE